MMMMINMHIDLNFSEYRRENYEPVGSESYVEDSVSDVIAILREQANRRISLSSGGDSDEQDDAREYMESEG